MKNIRDTSLPTRRVLLIGQIDDDNQRLLFSELNCLEEEGKQPIEIQLTSEGGYADNAFAIVGRMRQSPCKILVTGYGVVASAAVIILAAGNYRRIARDARVLVHEDSGKLKGSVSELEKAITQCRAEESKWNEQMEAYTGTPSTEWQDLHKQGDTFLTPEQCVKLRLADDII